MEFLDPKIVTQAYGDLGALVTTILMHDYPETDRLIAQMETEPSLSPDLTTREDAAFRAALIMCGAMLNTFGKMFGQDPRTLWQEMLIDYAAHDWKQPQ